jgi:hypothetical protein
MSAKTVLTCVCGFKTGDRVTMISGFTKEDGSAPDRLYGVVEDWGAGCGHLVKWDNNPYTATALPNPYVQRGDQPS